MFGADTDMRQLCPVCLRRVTHPAQVGPASRTFLEWSGTDMMCMGGHTHLRVPSLPTRWFSGQRWLYLDTSWDSCSPTPACCEEVGQQEPLDSGHRQQGAFSVREETGNSRIKPAPDSWTRRRIRGPVKTCVDFRPGNFYSQVTSAVQSMREPPQAIYRKGFDYEMHDGRRKVFEIGGRVSRHRTPQSITSRSPLRSRARVLSSHAWPGHWKFLRQCPR